jgi:hypothetical protein
MVKLTVKELLDLKGLRQISFVQVSRAQEAIAASVGINDDEFETFLNSVD